MNSAGGFRQNPRTRAAGIRRKALPRDGRGGALLQLAITLALIAPGVVLVNADLWGDYWLQYMWHGRQ